MRGTLLAPYLFIFFFWHYLLLFNSVYLTYRVQETIRLTLKVFLIKAHPQTTLYFLVFIMHMLNQKTTTNKQTCQSREAEQARKGHLLYSVLPQAKFNSKTKADGHINWES